MSINYYLKKGFSIGVGTGLNAVKFERHPILQNEYYDKIMIPAFLKFRYTKPLNSNWNITSDFNLGYQFSKNYFDYSDKGFDYIEKGGNLYSVSIGVRKKINKYFFLFKIGHEFNQFNNLIDNNLTDNN